MSTNLAGRLKIPQWGIVSRVVTSNDIVTDEHDVETDRDRTDLTTAVVHCTVRDADGNIVIQKTSADVAEIEILNQLVAATKGQARVYFVEADTAPLTVGAEYWFDCWAAIPGREEPIVDRGRFIVCESVTHISQGPTPNLPTFPASQTPQFRSFEWTAPSTAKQFTVPIPGTGMVDTKYLVQHSPSSMPSTGPLAPAHAPKAGRTATQFDFQTTGLGKRNSQHWNYATNDADGYAGGFYEFDPGNDDFTTPTLWGTVGKTYGAHLGFIQGAVSVDEITLRLTGNSWDSATGESIADTEDIVIPAGAADRYFESAKFWNGQVTITHLLGTAVAWNHGWVKYWDRQNQDFILTGLECLWDSDSANAGSDIELIHHSENGWTYQAAGGPLHSHVASRSGDLTDQENDTGYGAWKKTGLSQAVEGSNKEGLIFHVESSLPLGLGNQAFRSLNLTVEFQEDDPIEAGTIIDFLVRDLA